MINKNVCNDKSSKDSKTKLITTQWQDKYDEEDRINLIFDNITINLSIEDAEILFQELSQILYGRVLKEEVWGDEVEKY